MRSPLTVVMVCPGGFGSAPGAGRDSARLAAGAPAAADGDGGGAADWTTATAGGCAAAIARGRGACATRLGFGGVTTTSGTRTAPGGAAAGVGAAGVGAAGALGAASAGALGSAGAGADCSVSGFGAPVDSAGGAEDSWLRPGTGTSAAPMSSRAKGNIDRWSRVRLRARREAIVARRAAAIDANAASGLKPCRTDMTRFE